MIELKFKTTITHSDFKAFQKAAAKNSGIETAGKSFLKNFSIWFIVGLFSMIIMNLFKLKLIQFNYPTAIITSIFIFALLIFFIKRNVKKMKPLENGSIIGDHNYILTNNEIIDIKGNHRSSSTYESILNVIETKNNLFIFIDKIAAYLINKNSISSESSIDEIINYIKGKCNQ